MNTEHKDRFDAQVAAFEAAWEQALRDGQPSPAVRAFLPDDEPLRSHLGGELAIIDLERRLKRGENVRVESYLKQLPGIAANRDAVRALIKTEFEFRLEAEPDLSPEEYAHRFPGCFDPDLESTLEGIRAGCTTVGDSGSALSPSLATRGASAGRVLAAPMTFRTLRFHARGGLGQVSLARDEVLQREVAVKEVRLDLVSNPDNRQRFIAEAEITAQLDHPGVVPVHAVGQDDEGRPCYVMKFVNGPSLAQAIAEYHKKSARDGSLVFRDLLQRFVTVCQTVAYAHSKDVIHRDLKPQNIVLGEFGETIVLDWGLAQKLPATAADGPVGTPAYMPPEQVQGAADARSDVFGLGAVLYAILTGHAPHDRAGLETSTTEADNGLPTALARAAKADFVSPRRWKSTVPPALEAICRKAMQPKPEKRYAGAIELARDVQRFLADEPVSCYREPWLRRVARWSRRHPRITGAMLAALLFLAVGSAVWVRHVRQQQVRMEAEQLVREGEAHLEAGRHDAARTPLITAIAYLEKEPSAEDVRERAKRALDRADARQRMTEFMRTAGDAEHHLLGAYWALLPHEDPEGRRRITRPSERGASLLTGLAQVEIAMSLYGLPDNPEPLRNLSSLGIPQDEVNAVRTQAGELLFLWAVGVERHNQGGSPVGQQAARRRAVHLLSTALAVGNQSELLFQYRARFQRSLGEEPAGVGPAGPPTFLDYHFKAAELFHAKKWDQALGEFHQALALRPNDYWTMLRLAHTLETQKQFVQAESLVRSCTTLRPDDPMLHNYRGTILHQQRRWDEAVEAFEMTIRLAPDHAMAHSNLIFVHAERKKLADAEAALQRFLKQKPLPHDEAQAWTHLGVAYERLNQPDRALEHYTTALRLDPDCRNALRNRSLILQGKEQFVAAEKDLRRLLRLEPENGELYYLLGNWHAAQWQLGEAVKTYKEAVQWAPRLRDAYYNRGVVLRRLKRCEEAIRDQDQAIKLAPNVPDALHERAMCRASLHDSEGALEDVNAAIALSPNDAFYLLTRGKVLADLRTPESLKRSEADLSAAITGDPDNPDGYRSRGSTRLRSGSWQKQSGNSQKATEDFQGAVADFQEYLKRARRVPDRANILNDISIAYLEMGQLEEAETAVTASLAFGATPVVLTNRGNLLLRNRQVDRALADFEEALQIDATFPRALALRGQAHLRQGRYDEAVKDFDRILELQPNANIYETLLLRALAHQSRGDARTARADLERVTRDLPERLRGQFARGMLRLGDGQYTEAITELSRTVDDPVLRPFALGLRARAWLAVGGRGLSAAVADARAFAQERPQESVALVEAARIHVLAAEPGGTDAVSLRDRAVELLEQAVKLQPDLRRRLAADAELKGLRDDPRFKKLATEP